MTPNDNRPQNWPGQEAETDSQWPSGNPQGAPESSSQPQTFGGSTSAQPAAPVASPQFNSQAGSQDQFSGNSTFQPASPVTSFGAPAVGATFGQPQQIASSNSFVQQKKFWTKGKKITFGLLAASLVLLIGGGGAAYAYYNNSSRAVGDAISHALMADTAQIKGTAEITGDSDGVQANVKIDYDLKSNKDATQTDVGLDINVPPMSIDMSGSTVMDNNGNYYFKINNAKQILQNVLGGFGGGASVDPEMDGMNTLVEMVDNKWIKVSKEDLLESSTEEEKESFECNLKLSRDLRSDKSLLKEVGDVYRKNIFITSTALESDKFSTLHYTLNFDEQKAKDFANGFEGTKLYNRIKDCDKEFKIEQKEIAEAVKAANKANIEVWIDRWSHQFTKLSVKGKTDEAKYSATADTTFNKPVAVAIPAEATPFKTLSEEIEKTFGGMFGPAFEEYETEQPEEDLFTTNGEVNPSVLGARTFRLFR